MYLALYFYCVFFLHRVFIFMFSCSSFLQEFSAAEKHSIDSPGDGSSLSISRAGSSLLAPRWLFASIPLSGITFRDERAVLLALTAEKDKGMYLWGPNLREDPLKSALKPNLAKALTVLCPTVPGGVRQCHRWISGCWVSRMLLTCKPKVSSSSRIQEMSSAA